MAHLPHLVTDLGILLTAAGITTLIFKRLKQPLVLGYIIAGLLVGPHFAFFPTIHEIENIRIWAEIGVIFLLFSLGLEFSFKKLVKVGGASSVMALVEIVTMLLLGYTAGQLLGWSTMDSVFLGGILCISSTTIIVRAFNELGVKPQRFASLVFGVLIVEDLVAILLLVLLSTLAVSQQFAGTEMLAAVLKLGFFLAVWFLAGIFLIPTFLKRAGRLMNDETLLVVAIALCLLMVMLASQAGFSPALGAFIMGSILAETTKAEKIEHLITPVKDLFGAIFFVSVGILIDPGMMVTYAGPIALLSAITVLGKVVSITGGGLLAGQGLKTSVQAGMSVTQIGEFSFIIATLGLTLYVTSEFLYPIAVAVSAITTFTTPYMIRLSEPLYKMLEAVLPDQWKERLNRYSTGAHTINTTSDWKLVLRSYTTNMVVYAVVIIAIVMLADRYLNPFIIENGIEGFWADVGTTGATLVMIAPFLWALALHHPQKEAHSRIWANSKYRSVVLVLEFARAGVAVLVVGFLLNQFFSTLAAIIGGVVIIALLALFSERIQNFYRRIEDSFLSNLNDRQISDDHNIAPWGAHLTSFLITPSSAIIGGTLEELQIRERFGVNIAVIERGERTIMPPTRYERIYPYDKIYVFGTDEHIEPFRQYVVDEGAVGAVAAGKEDVRLQKLVISSSSVLSNKTIKESGIREMTNGLVVGIERAGTKIMNPDSNLTFAEGDILWIVGSPSRIKHLEETAVKPALDKHFAEQS
ncbi:CPA2 family monovalent cation:H+ antiporter-2 [Pontibacter ummariensis]|uniref:Monovalent cation:H+ antiporter-2, CPA2 family n=1 Tax=Pontibacter ummariensis TaxID=1610492 RepID=A0A239DET8_9BACT|nr:cation:proton antiporter [Pontibacter ummariensis]PRY14371.1 CPA2 family monovalent cation:H+ antiporter-2 [Pontibacter ummariensis]SNS30378.1 monovalent cation:H+ antiporter-2, CPA2 family [Pontibacter ummariensis]